jgi:radical SAM/Cys-rich protein
MTPLRRPLSRARVRSPIAQRALLDGVPLANADFDARTGGLVAGDVGVLQLNLGKRCNMSCAHCHVDAGPDREEVMDDATIAACLALLDRLDAHTVDLTGGAPELHPRFRELVDAAVARGKRVIDRCNLTILLTEPCRDLPEWLAARGVAVVASLPHWRKPSTDAQRGAGTFDRSIEAIRRLNAAGYGSGDPRRQLTLVHNPAGAWLPASQSAMEREWKDALARTQGVTFDRLIALTDMPIARYLDWLEASGNLEEYLRLLVQSYNPATLGGLMCRDTLSIGWDGRVFDCDFDQMLDLVADLPVPHVAAVDPAGLAGRKIRTGRHCFGCTAGAGSSCGGATT